MSTKIMWRKTSREIGEGNQPLLNTYCLLFLNTHYVPDYVLCLCFLDRGSGVEVFSHQIFFGANEWYDRLMLLCDSRSWPEPATPLLGDNSTSVSCTSSEQRNWQPFVPEYVFQGVLWWTGLEHRDGVSMQNRGLLLSSVIKSAPRAKVGQVCLQPVIRFGFPKPGIAQLWGKLTESTALTWASSVCLVRPERQGKLMQTCSSCCLLWLE